MAVVEQQQQQQQLYSVYLYGLMRLGSHPWWFIVIIYLGQIRKINFVLLLFWQTAWCCSLWWFSPYYVGLYYWLFWSLVFATVGGGKNIYSYILLSHFRKTSNPIVNQCTEILLLTLIHGILTFVVEPRGHFRFVFCLYIKTSCSKPLIFVWKVLHRYSLRNKGISEMAHLNVLKS